MILYLVWWGVVSLGLLYAWGVGGGSCKETVLEGWGPVG